MASVFDCFCFFSRRGRVAGGGSPLSPFFDNKTAEALRMAEASGKKLSKNMQANIDLLKKETQAMQAATEQKQEENKRLQEANEVMGGQITFLQAKNQERIKNDTSCPNPYYNSRTGAPFTLDDFPQSNFQEQIAHIKKIIKDLDHWYVRKGSFKAREIERAAIAVLQHEGNQQFQKKTVSFDELLNHKASGVERSLGEALDIHRWESADQCFGIKETKSRMNFPRMG